MARAKSAGPRRKDAAAKNPPRKARAKTGKGVGQKTKSASVKVASKSGSSSVVALPETLDQSSATSIRNELLTKRGSPLIVDAGLVRRTGMQAVQVLLAAARTWQSDGQSYTIANASDELLGTLALVGLSREQLNIEGFTR